MSSLLRSNITVALGTALSRISGLLRVFVFAAVIGQTLLADSYKIANETPNIIYDLLLGGVLSATLVPIFSSFLGSDDDEPDDHATNVVITISTTLMVALTVVAVALAPIIFRLYSLNLADGIDADLFRDVGTTLTRIFLVQILFYGLTGVANAYLNSRRRFFAAAWSPILPNLIIIVTLLSLPDPGDAGWTLGDVLTDNRLRWTLGFGATAGIAAMSFAVVPAMIRAGLRFRPAFEWRHPAVRKLLVLSMWTIGFVAANQVALLVIRNLALGEGEGIASAYFDAFTWFVLPHGLLAVSVATTGMFVLRGPIIGLMQRGQFDAVATLNTSRALAGLSIGLVGFSIYLFVLRGFYAHQDTRTPFVINVGENLLNIVFALLLVSRWGVLGLGLAYAFAYLLSSVWALTVLRDKVGAFPLAPIVSSCWRLALAAVLMAEAMWFVTRNADDDTGWSAIGQIVIGGVVGIVVYLAVAFALRSPELEWVRRRLPGRTDRT